MDYETLRTKLSTPRRPRRTRRFNDKWTWDWDFKPMNDNELFLAASDLSDHIAHKIMAQRFNADQDTLIHDISFLCDKKSWLEFTRSAFDWKHYEITEDRGIIVNELDYTMIRFDSHPQSVKLKIYGSQPAIEYVIAKCLTKFEVVDCYIQWMYSGNGDTIDIPLRPDKLPITEMYPFLEGEELRDYYDRFMQSDSSILLLIGPPGTGKTSFIRGLLQHRKTSAVVTYDANILEKDYVFAQFIEGEEEIMVLEDADTFLKARKEGNTMMHKFLNVGDGLVSTKGKKLIFSTNLPSVKDIDPALIRPGRCFDILKFDPLTQPQAELAASKLNVVLNSSKECWSIAELFNKQTHTATLNNQKIGFA